MITNVIIGLNSYLIQIFLMILTYPIDIYILCDLSIKANYTKHTENKF